MATNIYLNRAEDMQLAWLLEGAQALNQRLIDMGAQPAVLISKDRRLCIQNTYGELVPVTPHSLATTLRQECVPLKPGKQRDGEEPIWIEEPKLGRDLISAFIDSECWTDIPQVRQIAAAPIIRPDFTGRWEPGWDEQTRCWVVDGHKEDRTLADAGFTVDRVFSLFPLVDERLVADCIAAALTPLLSTAIEGALPAFLVTARKPGSGKSELAKLCSMLGNGGKQFTTWRKSEEMQKLIGSFAREDKRTVIFDNIKRNIDSADLESAITSRFLTFRTMATHSTEGTPCNTTWFFTANGASMSQDLLRRSIVVLLDKDTNDKGWRTNNAGSVLVQFVHDNEAALVTLMCDLITKWHDAGAPRSAKQVFSNFEEWSEIVGGILDVAGIPGFWEARDEVVQDAVETDESDEVAIIEAIATVMGVGKFFSAGDLWANVNRWADHMGTPSEDAAGFLSNWFKSTTGGKKYESETGGGIGMGKALSPYKDKVYDDCPFKVKKIRDTAGAYGTKGRMGYIVELKAGLSSDEIAAATARFKPAM